MKKIICILMCLLVMGTASFGQTSAAKKAPASGKVSSPAPAAKMKKDGTADMRYKENKAMAKPAGPMKKDGTPDMRYKANKSKGSKK